MRNGEFKSYLFERELIIFTRLIFEIMNVILYKKAFR